MIKDYYNYKGAIYRFKDFILTTKVNLLILIIVIEILNHFIRTWARWFTKNLTKKFIILLSVDHFYAKKLFLIVIIFLFMIVACMKVNLAIIYITNNIIIVFNSKT